MSDNPKILIACEFSQVVTESFRKRGFEAYSCDLLPGEINKKWHIQDDVLNHLSDGWDLMIAHPPCTYLCNSGVRWLKEDQTRWEDFKKGVEFFIRLKKTKIHRICIENPIPHKYTRVITGRYTQLIQPYNFGHGEQKATCLWLKNLPKLQHTTNVYDWNSFEYKIESGREQRVHLLPPSETRWMERSRTFKGIAEAMAEQWGKLLN